MKAISTTISDSMRAIDTSSSITKFALTVISTFAACILAQDSFHYAVGELRMVLLALFAVWALALTRMWGEVISLAAQAVARIPMPAMVTELAAGLPLSAALSPAVMPMVNQRKVLIVDDDPEMQLSLGIRLKAMNYAVISAGDGVAGIEEARMHNPDLILLDLGLPTADGFNVLERLRESNGMSSIPVIVVSGRDKIANCGRALQFGAKAFVQKPFDNAQLMSLVAQHVGSKGNLLEYQGAFGAAN